MAEARALTLTAPCEITAAASDPASANPRRFSMTAYTGGPMTLAGWRFPVVVDLAGMDVGDSARPIFLGHQQDVDDVVGQTDRIEIADGQLVASGNVLGDSPRVQRVVALADKGFRWQASIGAQARQVDFIKAGQSVTVNGRAFDGPLNVARQSVLGEISFVPLGADTRTSALIATQPQSPTQKEISMDFTQWLQAGGFDPDTLSDDQTATLKASFEASQNHATAVADPREAPEAPEAKSPEASEPQDPVKQLRASAAGELRRQSRILEICGSDHATLAAKGIEEGWDETRTELEVLRASRPSAPNPGSATDRTPDHNVLVAAACRAAGMTDQRAVTQFGEKIIEASDRFRGVGFQEFCEIAAGRRLPRYRQDASGWLQAAFSTLSLPGVLSNVAHKMLLDGFNYVEDAWRQVSKIGSVSDFKEHTRYRLTDDMKFQPVGKGGELKHGKLGEENFTQKADTHGIMFSLDRKDIINDDLGAFAAIPQVLGMGSAEAIAEAVFELLLANPGNFFSTGNKNYLAGVDTALSIEALTAAELLFLEQTKPNGRPLSVSPQILFVPPALSVIASQLMNATAVNETTTTNKPKVATNPHAGKFRVVTSAYLSNSTFTGLRHCQQLRVSCSVLS
ncbi:MAG: Mu-like prophage major head subunit gpT family protein [Planctomycetota bacterium]